MIRTTVEIICDGCEELIEESSFITMSDGQGGQLHLHSYDHLPKWAKKKHEEMKIKKKDAEELAMRELESRNLEGLSE